MRRMLALLIASAVALVAAGAAAQDGTPDASPAGGETVEVVLEPRPGRGTVADADALDQVRSTLERRLDLLGVDGATVEVAERQIVVQVPAGAVETETLLPVLSEVGLLEIIDPQGQFLAEGTLVATTLGPPLQGARGGPVYETIVDGNGVATAFEVQVPDNPTPTVGFRLRRDAAERFFDFTSANVGQPLSILVDKRVVSSATIQAPIAAEGIISGVAPGDVRGLAVRIGSGPLPLPLAVVGVDGEAPPGTPAA